MKHADERAESDNPPFSQHREADAAVIHGSELYPGEPVDLSQRDPATYNQRRHQAVASIKIASDGLLRTPHPISFETFHAALVEHNLDFYVLPPTYLMNIAWDFLLAWQEAERRRGTVKAAMKDGYLKKTGKTNLFS